MPARSACRRREATLEMRGRVISQCMRGACAGSRSSHRRRVREPKAHGGERDGHTRPANSPCPCLLVAAQEVGTQAGEAGGLVIDFDRREGGEARSAFGRRAPGGPDLECRPLGELIAPSSLPPATPPIHKLNHHWSTAHAGPPRTLLRRPPGVPPNDMSSRPRRGSFSSPPPPPRQSPALASPSTSQPIPQLTSGANPSSPRRLSRPSSQQLGGLAGYQNGGRGGREYDPRVYSRVQAWRGESSTAGVGATAGGDHHLFSSSPPDERDSDGSMETIIIPIKDVSKLSLASRVRADSRGTQPVGLSRGRTPLTSTTSDGLQRRGSAQLASGLALVGERRASSPGLSSSRGGLGSQDPASRGRTSHPLATSGPFGGAQGITPLPTHPSPDDRNPAGSLGMGMRASSPGPGPRPGFVSGGGAYGWAQTHSQQVAPPTVGRRTVGFNVPPSQPATQPLGRSPSPSAGPGRRPSLGGLGRPPLTNGWESSGPRTPTPTPTPSQPRPNGLTAPQPPTSLSRSSSGATVTPMSEVSRQALDSYARSFHVSAPPLTTRGAACLLTTQHSVSRQPSPRDDPHRLYGSLEHDARNGDGRRREGLAGSSLSPNGGQGGAARGGGAGGRRALSGGWS